MLSVFVETLGCRLNQYESDAILSDLIGRGQFRRAELSENPDIAIVNTCTVTNRADGKNRSAINRIRRLAPDARIFVTGCQAQTDPEKLLEIEGVSLLVGNQSKHLLAEMIARATLPDRKAVKSLEAGALEARNQSAFSFARVLPQGHTRSYLKIQDGCDRSCSYCKIPLARGKGVSRPWQDVLAEVDFLVDGGQKEIVLTGVNLGWYRDRKAGLSFTVLLSRILERLKGGRLRLSSIEPCDAGQELAELFQHPAFCKYLHIPVQSGSAAILKRMRRTYNPVSFYKRIDIMRKYAPDLFLGTDVIAGFPGEGQAEFQETLVLLADCQFHRIHAFPFSRRENTQAAQFAQTCPRSEKKERISKLRSLEEKNWATYAASFLNKTRKVIVEKKDNGPDSNSGALNFNRTKEAGRSPAGRSYGLTDNYLRVVLDQPISHGNLVTCRLDAIRQHGLLSASLA